MKLLLSLLILCSLNAGAQIGTMPVALPYPTGSLLINETWPIGRSVSRYDTTILFPGVDSIKCASHHFVSKSVATGMYSTPGIECLVWHGATGCPDKWMNENSICTVCLRHINIKESRTVEIPVDEYQQALDRLNKIQK